MEKSGLKKLNTMIFLLTVWPCPAWFISMNTSGISFYCILGSIVFMIATAKIYKNVSRIENGRIILNCFRTALIFCIAGLYLPSLVISDFDDTKCMYSLKRLNYAHGLYGFSGERLEHYKKLFPEKLPDVCDDYEYLTEGLLHDRFPGSRLIFRTDEETIERYAEYYAGFCDKISVEDDESEKTQNELELFMYRAGLDDRWREEFENAEIYSMSGRFREGVLLDKDSGYVVASIDEPK